MSAKQAFTVTAQRLSDGKILTLEKCRGLSLTASLSSPALSLHGTFACKRAPGELGEIRVFHKDNLLFAGMADEQTTTLSPQGLLLSLDARSKGAALLDNEATPCALAGVRLTSVFDRMVKPYGFHLYCPQWAGSLQLYTVRAGMCEWEAFCAFVRRVYSITPYVWGDTVYVDTPRPALPLTFSNSGSKLPFTKLSHTVAPCRVISKVILRDKSGQYRAAVSNSAAHHYSIPRRRYAVPAGEFVEQPGLDGNQRIRRSMYERETVFLSVPFMLDAYLGQSAQIVDDALTLYNLLVADIRWEMGQNGILTHLTLKSAVYYC